VALVRDFATTRDGIKLRYEIRGEGAPLALVMGFSGSMRGWNESFLELLEPRFKLILIDNRGTGESDKPEQPWTMDTMASDVAAVLDAAKLPRTHVFGVSMGGMIAQTYALTYPGRVRGLILGCTNCGRTASVAAKPDDLANLMPDPKLTPIEQGQRAMTVVLSRGFLGSNAGREFLMRMAAEYGSYPVTPLHTFAHQGAAIGGFDSHSRLGEIKMPTLIVHGDDDLIVPFGNAEVLQKQIAGAKLHKIKGAGHMFWVEAPEEVARGITAFLSALN